MAYGQDADGDFDMDHPNSNLWPEVFCNGREQFSEGFYQTFPWTRGVDPFEETDEGALLREFSGLNFQGLPKDAKAEVPPVLSFVNNPISLELDDLPEEEQSCPICRETYRQGEEEEMPLELPCQHVVGENCLLRWLSNVSGIDDANPHDTCPFCRSKLASETKRPLDTMEGVEQLLRDANYLLTAEGPMTLNTEFRQRWEGVKEYVHKYLNGANSKRKRIDTLQDIFAKALFCEIIEALWRTRTAETMLQLSEWRDDTLNKLASFEDAGLIRAYLECQAGEYIEDDDSEYTRESIEADMKAMPFFLSQLIRTTYSRCIARESLGGHGSEETRYECFLNREV